MKKKQLLIILGLIVVGATIARVMPILWERDYWYDEAFTGILLKAGFGEMNQMIFDDVHPPLYYWLAKPWSAMFGYSPMGIRLMSLLFGIATVISGYWVAAKMFASQRAGLLAAAFLAFSPFAIQYSQEARMYSLFGFLFLWSVWFFYQALKENQKRDWILWGVFAGLSFYTHYLALFFFVLFYVTFVLHQKIFNKEKFLNSILGGKGFWIGVVVVTVFFASWFKIFFLHMMKGNLGWIGVSYLSDIPKTLQIFLFGHPPGTGGVPSPNPFHLIEVGKNVIHEVPLFDDYSVGIMVLLLLCIFCTAMWSKNKARKEILVLSMMSLGTLTFLVILSFLNIKLYVSRYFMPAAVLVFVLFAGVLVKNYSKKWIWLATLAIYAGILLLVQPVDYSKGWTQIWNQREELVGDKLVVAGNPFAYTSARFYFGEENVRYFNKGNPAEDFSGWVVVGNKNRISNPQEIQGDMIIVDETCDWSDHGINLQKIQLKDDLFVCKISD